MNTSPEQYFLKDNGIFPNSKLPVLHYKAVLDIPIFFAARKIKNLFHHNGWSNNWRDGIYTYHHYHSITHEAMGVIKGSTQLMLGGEDGQIITVRKGDVIIIPAGVAHKNLGKEKDVICIGGYPEGKDFDMNYGKPGERPHTDENIARLPVPGSDPISGKAKGVALLWQGKQDNVYR